MFRGGLHRSSPLHRPHPTLRRRPRHQDPHRRAPVRQVHPAGHDRREDLRTLPARPRGAPQPGIRGRSRTARSGRAPGAPARAPAGPLAAGLRLPRRGPARPRVGGCGQRPARGLELRHLPHRLQLHHARRRTGHQPRRPVRGVPRTPTGLPRVHRTSRRDRPRAPGIVRRLPGPGRLPRSEVLRARALPVDPVPPVGSRHGHRPRRHRAPSGPRRRSLPPSHPLLHRQHRPDLLGALSRAPPQERGAGRQRGHRPELPRLLHRRPPHRGSGPDGAARPPAPRKLPGGSDTILM